MFRLLDCGTPYLERRISLSRTKTVERKKPGRQAPGFCYSRPPHRKGRGRQDHDPEKLAAGFLEKIMLQQDFQTMIYWIMV